MKERLSRLSDYISIMLLMVIIGLVYKDIFAIPFAADDYIWLERSSSDLFSHMGEIFKKEINCAYFDPLIYILFRINHKIGYLDPSLYHAVDLAIHTGNSILLYFFIMAITENRSLSTIIGILFGASFPYSNAVLWPSARVDTVMVMLTLASLLFFYKYLHERKGYVFSFICFILALSCKGTALVIPLLLAATELIFFNNNKEKFKRKLIRYIPFIVIDIIYVIALKYSPCPLTGRPKALPDFMAFVNKLEIGIKAFVIPDELTNHLLFFFICTTAFVLILVLFYVNRKSKVVQFGVVVFAVGILPLAATAITSPMLGFATEDKSLYLLLESPSHRIYMAGIGFSIFMGGIIYNLSSFIRRPIGKNIFLILILTTIVTLSAFAIELRAKRWTAFGSFFSNISNMVKKSHPTLPKGSHLIFVGNLASNYTYPAMLKVYYNDPTIKVDVAYNLFETLRYRNIKGGNLIFAVGAEGAYEMTATVNEYWSTVDQCSSGIYGLSKECLEKGQRMEYIMGELVKRLGIPR